MQKWEYLIVQLPADSNQRLSDINTYGAEGWELVAMEYRCCYFKRLKN
jgi:hypothetical protein